MQKTAHQRGPKRDDQAAVPAAPNNGASCPLRCALKGNLQSFSQNIFAKMQGQCLHGFANDGKI